jgi:hypothetical protein
MSSFTLNPELGTAAAGDTDVSDLDSGDVALNLGSGTVSTSPTVAGLTSGDSRLILNDTSNSLTTAQAQAWTFDAIADAYVGSSGSSSALTRSSNNNAITVIPDLADINITSTIDRLADSTTYFAVVPGSGEPEAVISRREVECAIEYRNSFKSGAPLTEYTNFFRQIQGSYFAGYGAQTFFGGGFSNDSILYWVKKYFALEELTKFIDATSSFARQTWSSSTYNAIHLKFILKKYSADTTSFFRSFSDSIGLLANSKYHQLDSTQPIFDITQEGYGVPIPFTANMENKVGPTARNLMYNLSKGTTASMRRNLLNLAYYNAAETDNFKVSSKVAHACNLVNDVAFFVEFYKRTESRANLVKAKFSSYSGKLFNFIQYISNIGNRCGLNLRDIYAPINGYDKDFVKTPGSTDLAVGSLDAAAIDSQISELNNFAIADATIARDLYANTVQSDGDFSSNQFISKNIYFPGNGTWSNSYDNPTSIPADQGGTGNVDNEEDLPPVEPNLPTEASGALPDGWSRLPDGSVIDENGVVQPLYDLENSTGTSGPQTDANGSSGSVVPLSDQVGVGRTNTLRVTWYGDSSIDQTTAQEVANGTLRASDQYNGAYGALEYHSSVASTLYPGGTVLRITNTDGTPYNPSGQNPTGTYTVRDTGNFRTSNINTYNGLDFYTDSKTTYRHGTSINVTPVAIGTQVGLQYQRAYDYYSTRNPDLGYNDDGDFGGAPLIGDDETLPDVIGSDGSVNSFSSGTAPDLNVDEATADAVSPDIAEEDTISLVDKIPNVNLDGTELTSSQQRSAVNAAFEASARPYSNKQRMFPFSFKIRVEDYDGEERSIDVDFLLKKIVTDNFNPYRRIATLQANYKHTLASESSSDKSGGSDAGQTIERYINLLKTVNGRNLISSGNISAIASALGVDLTSGINGTIYNQLKSVIDQNALTSRTLAQSFETFLQLGADRLPTNLLSQITSSQGIYDSFAGQLNSLGVGSLLPTSSDIISGLNPFNYIDINIQDVIPSVSLGSLSEVANIIGEIGTSGPPTSIGGAFQLAKQIKSLICSFELPFISWPVVENLIKGNYKDFDIGKAIKDEFNKIVDRLGELFNPSKIYEAIKQNVVSYFKNLYKELFVCTEAEKQKKNGSNTPTP